MKKVNEVFFGEHGLTSTSANHLANIAQEKIVSNEAKLKNLNFVTTTRLLTLWGHPLILER